MMATVKKMFESYEHGKDQYHKRLTELQLGLNTTIYDLEKQGTITSQLHGAKIYHLFEQFIRSYPQYNQYMVNLTNNHSVTQ
jgi:hypothetical protein